MKNLSVQHQIASIFNDAQRTLNHKQLIKSMLVLYKQHQHSFVPKFKTMVNKILPVATKESSIDKLIKFIGEAVCQSSSIKRSEFQSSQNSEESDDEAEEDETLLNIMFRHFIDTSQAKSKAIRWRSCQIISAILGGLDKDFDIDTNIWEDLQHFLVIRLKDNYPNARIAAISGLHRLHDPTSKKDKVVKEFTRILSTDPLKDVRKAVVMSLGVSKKTIPIFIGRSKDVHSDVRKTVYRVLQGVSIKLIDKEDLVYLLNNGMNDRDPVVQKSCQQLITKWLTKIPLLDFIALLNPEENEKVVEVIVKFAVKLQQFDFNTLENIEKHPIPFSIVHRIFLQQKYEEGDEDDENTPEIFDICKQLIPMYEANQDFIMKQLLLICVTLDYSNEAGRRHLSTILRKFLQEIRNEMLQVKILSLLRKLHPDESEFLQIVLEILADIVEPIEDEDAESYDLEKSTEILVQALSICEDILRHTNKGIDHPGIRGIKENYIVNFMRSSEVLVREKALSCLGLFCLLDVNEAKKHLLIFVKVLDSDEPDTVQLISVRVLFDFLTLFGPEPLIQQESKWPSEYKTLRDELNENVENSEFSCSQSSQSSQEAREEKEENEQEGQTDMRSITMLSLVRCLTQGRNIDIRTTAVEGFCKLLLNNFICDSNTISVLITLYFYPSNELFDHQKLTQCLGVFFPAYCIRSKKHTDSIMDAFVPTVDRILQASQYSPLRKLNVEKVVQFMLTHIDLYKPAPSPSSHNASPFISHNQLAAGMVQSIVGNFNSNPEASKLLCKVLSCMRITKTNEEVTTQLSSGIVQLIDKIKEKPILKILNNIQITLHGTALKKRSISPINSPPPPPRKKRKLSDDPLHSPPPERAAPAAKKATGKRKRTDSVDNNRKRELTLVSPPPRKRKPAVIIVEHDKIQSPEADAEEKKEEEEEEGANPADATETPKTPTTPKPVGVIISFSGFSIGDPEYHFEYLKTLLANAKTLGAKVVLGNVVDSTITHIVSPPNRRTMKTIIGALTNRWIVTPRWLTQSAKKGKFLPAEQFGVKVNSQPFKNKKVYISTKFIQENPNKQFDTKLIQSLICQLGKGSVVKSENEADLILCAKSDSRDNPDVQYLAWKEFFEFLQPTV